MLNVYRLFNLVTVPSTQQPITHRHIMLGLSHIEKRQEYTKCVGVMFIYSITLHKGFKQSQILISTEWWILASIPSNPKR